MCLVNSQKRYAFKLVAGMLHAHAHIIVLTCCCPSMHVRHAMTALTWVLSLSVDMLSQPCMHSSFLYSDAHLHPPPSLPASPGELPQSKFRSGRGLFSDGRFLLPGVSKGLDSWSARRERGQSEVSKGGGGGGGGYTLRSQGVYNFSLTVFHFSHQLQLIFVQSIKVLHSAIDFPFSRASK